MFITFEGPEGSGKSTQLKRVATYLTEHGFEIITTREPGGTPIGNEIRACVHHVDHTAMVPEAELLLYSASRAQLVQEVIKPALAKGQIVLCDRYADSTIAYQGYGRGLDLDALNHVTHFATQGLKPDLTLLLDIDVERGLARREVGGLEMNRLDLEKVDFHRRVRDGYKALVAAEPNRWVVVNADQLPDAVFADLVAVLMVRLGKTAVSST